MKYKTEQEEFWAGEFGDEYIGRNKGTNLLASNVSFFSGIFKKTAKMESVIEFGANIGLNLEAIKILLPGAHLLAVEINAAAVAGMKKRLPCVNAYHQSILDFKVEKPCTLSFTRGVLIHINPEQLPAVYDTLYTSSARYILISEYYNPVPVEIPYRGHEGRLFKRDFAGEMMDRFPDIELSGYGFEYHRDPNFPRDDASWFLLEKKTPGAQVK